MKRTPPPPPGFNKSKKNDPPRPKLDLPSQIHQSTSNSSENNSSVNQISNDLVINSHKKQEINQFIQKPSENNSYKTQQNDANSSLLSNDQKTNEANLPEISKNKEFIANLSRKIPFIPPQNRTNAKNIAKRMPLNPPSPTNLQNFIIKSQQKVQKEQVLIISDESQSFLSVKEIRQIKGIEYETKSKVFVEKQGMSKLQQRLSRLSSARAELNDSSSSSSEEQIQIQSHHDQQKQDQVVFTPNDQGTLTQREPEQDQPHYNALQLHINSTNLETMQITIKSEISSERQSQPLITFTNNFEEIKESNPIHIESNNFRQIEANNLRQSEAQLEESIPKIKIEISKDHQQQDQANQLQRMMAKFQNCKIAYQSNVGLLNSEINRRKMEEEHEVKAIKLLLKELRDKNVLIEQLYIKVQ